VSARAERAVVFTGPGVAELQTVEAGDRPLGPTEVAGRTLATLVSVGTEVAVLTSDGFPARPGYAAVFEVAAVGPEVVDLKPGDRAFCLGGHQSFQRAERPYALPVPEGVPSLVAPFARIMGVVMSTLTTTAARPPAKVLVTGLGIVGHLAARIFAVCGYEVIAVDPDPRRRDIAAAAGLRRVEAAVPLGDQSVAGQVDLVAECSGHDGATLDGCRAVRRGGEVVLVGVPWRRRTDATAHDLLWAIFHQYAVVRSGWEWEVPLLPAPFRHNSLYGNMAAALTWLAEGRLSVEGLYEVARPEDAGDVYSCLASGAFDKLTAVFDWSANR
jgi:threonine dehydrogenase-like Zn-dependent dehydrogenase